MKYKRNRVLSFLLAFIMVFSMSATGFADNISDIDTPEEVLIDEEIPYSEEVISNTDESMQPIDEPILEDNSIIKENLDSVVKLEVSHVDSFSGNLISKDVYDLEIGKEVIPTDYILENIRDKFVESDTPQFVITENSSFTLYYENNEMIGDNPDNLSMEEIGKGEPISEGYAYPKIGFRTNANMFLKYNLNSNEWPNQGAVNLSKVAEPVQGSTNLWEVTLKIEGKNLLTTSDIVLVLDKSGSMSGEKISNLKLAAKEFVDNLLLPDGVNRIALVTFDNGATVKSNFVDYSGKTLLKNEIDSITASGGTNMQAGIHVAQTLLDSSNATNKVMVLLGDGQPTYSYKVIDATGITLSTHKWWSNPDIIISNPQIVAVDYSQVVGNGSSFNISNSDSYEVICTEPNHYHGPFPSGFPNNHGIPTIFEANLAKDKGTQIYSIAFNADSNGQNVLNNSQNAGYYQINSTDLSSLNAVFSEISGKISYAAKDGVVVDPMGDMFDLASSEIEIYVSQGNFQIQGNSIIWNTGNIAEGNPATLKYLVRIKAGADANILYPTNQETVFSYTDVYENDTSKNFPIPEVSIGGGRIILIGYEVNENGDPINSDGVIVDRPDLANIIYNRNYSNNPLSYNQTYTITPDNLDGYEYQEYLWNGNEGNETTLQILLLANKPTETVYFGYYKIEIVTVTFNENYPGSNVYTKNINKGSSLGSEMPADPQRIGYTFTGWNTEPNGTGSVFSSSTIVNQNITVYAQWQKNTGPELQIEGYTGVYDGLGHSITVGNLVEGDKVYYSEDGETWLEENPSYTDVGEYKVYVKVENPNYEDRTGLATVTITEKEVTITIDNKTKVYGTADPVFTGTVEGLINENDLGEITYVRTNEEENVGTYQGVLDANYTNNPNYKVEVIKGNFVITKAQGEALTLEGYTGVYDGLGHSITVVNLVEGDKVYYSEDGETWLEENPSYTDVGEYKVYVKVENPNYEDRTGLATVTITEKEVTITIDNKTKVYGTADPVFTGTVEGLINENDLGEITYVRTNEEENVGTYQGVLDANYTNNPNYKVEVIKGNFVITKAQGEALTLEGYTGVYDGLEHSITVGNLVEGDKVYYSEDGETWLEENPSYTDVGEYKVYVKVENPNYENRTGLATVTITEKEVTITIDNKTKVYGTADPVFTGTVEGLINENDLGEITYVRTNEEENVGTYQGVLDANYTNNPNYKVEVIKGNFVIIKAQGEALTLEGYTGVYDGLGHSITVGNLVEGDKVYYSEDGETWLEENPSYTDVGEYKVYVKVENPNYEDRTGLVTVEITARSITVQSQNATKVYDGTPLTKNEFTITNGNLVTGENIKVVITGSQTNVGSSKNTIQSISINSGDKDVTGNYSITKVEGTLTVNSQVIPPYYPPYIPPEEEIDEEVPTDLPQLTDEHIAYIQGYPDNTVRPLGYITREEVATVFYRLLDAEYRNMIFTTNQNFLDVKATRWSNKHIATLANAEIILGYEDGTFRPGNYITRAELAVIASRFDNLSPFESDKFSDIKGHWANKYINSAAEKGWVKGYTDGTFKPDNYITRAEFVTLVNAVLDRKVTKDYILEDARQFPDLTEDKWYYEDMQEAINSHEYEWLEDNTEKWTKIYYPDLDM